MSTARIEEPEGDLLNVLEWLGPLEWRKYRGRYPEVRSRGRIERLDQSAYPPSFSFRIENEVGDVVIALRLAIESYNGKVRWTLEGRRRDTLGGRIGRFALLD